MSLSAMPSFLMLSMTAVIDVALASRAALTVLAVTLTPSRRSAMSGLMRTRPVPPTPDEAVRFPAATTRWTGPQLPAAECPAALLDQPPDHRREDELQGQVHLAAGADERVGPAHERVVQHRQQVREVDVARTAEPDDEEALVEGRDVASDERVRRVDHRHALEVDVRPRELGSDVVDVVRHAPKDRLGDRLGRVAAGVLVELDLLG